MENGCPISTGEGTVAINVKGRSTEGSTASFINVEAKTRTGRAEVNGTGNERNADMGPE